MITKMIFGGMIYQEKRHTNSRMRNPEYENDQTFDTPEMPEAILVFLIRE